MVCINMNNLKILLGGGFFVIQNSHYTLIETITINNNKAILYIFDISSNYQFVFKNSTFSENSCTGTYFFLLNNTIQNKKIENKLFYTFQNSFLRINFLYFQRNWLSNDSK